MSQEIIDAGQTGGVIRENLNGMFTELYGSVAIPVKISNTGTTTLSIPANTWIERIIVFTYTGSPSIKIGTTLGGTDILLLTSVGTSLPILIQIPYESTTTYYFTISGGTVNMRIDEILNLF